MSSYEIIETGEQDYLYVERKTSMAPDDISSAMNEAFGIVWAFMQAKSIPPAGAALSVYYTYDPQTVEFRAGFFVSPEDAAKAEGVVMAGKTPATRVVHLVHTGPYSAMRDTYGTVMQEMQKDGLEMAAPTWEVYLNDPDTTPEAELKTEIFIAIA